MYVFNFPRVDEFAHKSMAKPQIHIDNIFPMDKILSLFLSLSLNTI